MSKFQLRSPLVITAALALAPTLAFAGETNQKRTTTTTTTTTAAPQAGANATPSPGAPSPAADQQGSAVLAPSTPPDMTETDAMRMNNGVTTSDQGAIDPAQVQKVFGMDVALINLKTLNKDQIKVLQQRLQERGFYRGKVDGAMGPQTRNALSGLMAQQYALNQRLVNQGQITEQFASSIGVDTRGRAPVMGVDDQATQHPAPRANVQGTTQTPPPNQ